MEHHVWTKYVPWMGAEWKQLRDEGYDVAKFESVCRELAATDAADEAGDALFAAMCASPRSDLWKSEPDDLEEIRALRPAEGRIRRGERAKALTREERLDKLAGAWLGRVSGCMLGKPFEGWRRAEIEAFLRETDNAALERFADARGLKSPELEKKFVFRVGEIADGVSIWDDDTNYPVIGLRLLETCGMNFTAQQASDNWLALLPALNVCTAERVSYRNALWGIPVPETARFRNPFRELVGAQIRADIFGYVALGDDEFAAELAHRDATISHVKNGIYGAMFAAAMISAAWEESDPRRVVERGLAQIPEGSRLATEIRRVLDRMAAGEGFEAIAADVHGRWDEKDLYDWCHTVSNAILVAGAILGSGGDARRGTALVVGAGFDTDSNGATVGSVLGLLSGREKLSPLFRDTFHTLKALFIDCGDCRVERLAERTLALIK